MPDIVWTADLDGTMTFANDRWLHFCGIAPEQNARESPGLVVHPDDRERCLAQWTRALREGTDYEIEVRNRRHDGEYRWFLTRATPVRDAGGHHYNHHRPHAGLNALTPGARLNNLLGNDS